MSIKPSDITKALGFALNAPPSETAAGLAAAADSQASGLLSKAQAALSAKLNAFGVYVANTTGYDPFAALEQGAAAAAAKTDVQLVTSRLTPLEMAGIAAVLGGIAWISYRALRRA